MQSLFGLWRKNDEYVGTGWRIDGCCTCEPAKCRQHRIGLSKIKAGQSQGLLAHAADPYAGVDVAGKTIRIAVLVFGDVVYKTECFQLQVFFMHFDTCLFIPILFQDVMVAFDQANVDIGKVISPSPEEGQLVVLAAVKKISYDEQLQGLKILYLRQQPMKVLFIDGGWHRDTGFTKMSCFAKMKIGEDERFFFFPKDTTFRR